MYYEVDNKYENNIRISPIAYIYFIKYKPENIIKRPRKILIKKLQKSDKLVNLVRSLRSN